MPPEDYSCIHALPTAEIYQTLRKRTGLSAKSQEAAERGLAGSLFCVLLKHQDAIIGMGRVIGDGGSFYQVVDIAVLPEHQGKGLGKRIMAEIRAYLDANAPDTAYISLLADVPADKLYAQFGFTHTAPRTVGMAIKKKAAA